MTLLRGYYGDAELHEWLRHMWWVEKHMGPGEAYLGSKLAVIEMLFSATCGFMDMYFFPDEAARAARELGVRARLGPVIMGRVDPWRAVEAAAAYAKRISGDDLVGGVINVHSIYAAPLEAVREGHRVAQELGIPFHIHVSETRREVYEAKKRYGLFPVQLLDKLGALSKVSVLVHAGWIASWELGLVKEKGASLVHCPASNMKLATAGHFPLYEAMESGINVALGTDGAASNDSLNMFSEMKTAVLMQRHSYWDTRVRAKHVLRAATTGSAKAMMLPSGAGTIRIGAPGDLVVLDVSNPSSQPLRRDNLEQILVYSCEKCTPSHVLVGGRIVLSPENREKLLEEAARAADELSKFIEKIGPGETSEPPCSPREACS
ncbi:amidohydrolase [Pyrofollis japonicus]|nr:amidohydrolase [Pyrofollis japonicus]